MQRCLIIFAFLISTSARAQFILKGRVFENKTRIGLAGIRVDNLNNNKTTLTNNTGNFAIPAKNGDMLVFKGFAYQVDTLVLTKMNEQEIFMEPVTNQLNQVNINTTVTKNFNTYYDPLYHGQPVVYQRDREQRPVGGIIWRLWWWKKDENKKSKLEKLQQKFAVMDKIQAVFQPGIIAQYIPLTGEDLNNFITLYTPTPKIVTEKDFNLVNYLNECLKKYEKLPPDKRQPPKLTE
ncbi:hypothetical protein ACFQZI_02245 [Mucilaginibacter lutimaris]|uniref:CarboxypepD_reg-like domain-containing protein n=1 Tax=Mucilaginibacter lutimaris TaxID=931629 RepID=A0ABW2ZBL9_9SPHI